MLNLQVKKSNNVAHNPMQLSNGYSNSLQAEVSFVAHLDPLAIHPRICNFTLLTNH